MSLSRLRNTLPFQNLIVLFPLSAIPQKFRRHAGGNGKLRHIFIHNSVCANNAVAANQITKTQTHIRLQIHFQKFKLV